MSVKDFNKYINVYNALDNTLLFSMDYNDFLNIGYCEEFFSCKINSFLNDDIELFIKFGYKS